MNYSNWDYQIISLAAVTQCAWLVHRLAAGENADSETLAACIQPLLVFSPDSAADVYPSVRTLSPGLKVMQEIFSNENMQYNGEIVRYLLGILALRQKLMSNNTMQQSIRKQLEKVKTSANLNDPEQKPEDEAILFKQIACVYQSTVSTLSFRIHVKGNADTLRDELIAHKIRSLLLAGIRSAVLWYQLGGRRWQLLVYRKKVRNTVSTLRRSLMTTV